MGNEERENWDLKENNEKNSLFSTFFSLSKSEERENKEKN